MDEITRCSRPVIGWGGLHATIGAPPGWQDDALCAQTEPARTPERTTTVPMTPEEEDLATNLIDKHGPENVTKNLIRDTAPGPDDSRTAAFSSADVGKLIHFPWTGNAYRIAAVNEEDETVTFEVLGEPGDRATETFADLADVDAQVQP